jgi:hypothetical protein
VFLVGKNVTVSDDRNSTNKTRTQGKIRSFLTLFTRAYGNGWDNLFDNVIWWITIE